MKRLTDPNMEACFLKRLDDRTRLRVDSIALAQGVMFHCPHPGHGHMVVCWFRNPPGQPQVPDDEEPLPGRWEVSGSSLADLTLHPSVDVKGGENGESCWHGWVKQGVVT